VHGYEYRKILIMPLKMRFCGEMFENKHPLEKNYPAVSNELIPSLLNTLENYLHNIVNSINNHNNSLPILTV